MMEKQNYQRFYLLKVENGDKLLINDMRMEPFVSFKLNGPQQPQRRNKNYTFIMIFLLM